MENSQRIKKILPSRLDVAKAYYSILNILNSLQLTNRELEFMAYLGVQGESFTKEEYVIDCQGSVSQASQLIHSLRKKGIIMKKQIVLHSALLGLDFQSDVVLNIHLNA